MARKPYYIVLLLVLILLLQNCGNDTSFDAVVVAPADSEGCTFDGTVSPGPFSCRTNGPLVFKVEKSSTDTTPVADANVRIDIGNSAGEGVQLLNSAGTACYFGSTIGSGNPDCFSVETQTDNLGVLQFQVLTGPISGCGGGTTDITGGDTFAQVTTSASFATWKMTSISVKCSTTATTTTTTTSTTTTTCTHPLHYIHFLLFFLLVLARLLLENFVGIRKPSA